MTARPLGSPVRHLGAVVSTMTEAAAWAAGGAPHGALVVAEHQTGGRGRHGRAWTDAPGESLMLSLVLRPRLAAGRLGLVGLAAGLAVAEAVERFGVEATLKWPNDVRVGERKLAGVLAEATWSGPRPTVVLGIGMNVRQTSFPSALADRAVSLRQVIGRPVERLDPLAPLLDRLAARLADAEAAPDRLVRAVEGRMEGIGSAVAVCFPGVDLAPLEGVVLGLAPDGALRLGTDAGEEHVRAGEVTLALDSAAP